MVSRAPAQVAPADGRTLVLVKRRPAARLLTVAGAMVLLGLATTVAVAWVLVFAVKLGPGSVQTAGGLRARDPARGEGRGMVMSGGLSATGSLHHYAFFANVPLPPDAMAKSLDGDRLALLAPAWAREAVFPWLVSGEPWPPEWINGFNGAVGRGWPLIALWSSHTKTMGATGTSKISGGIPLSSWDPTDNYDRILPYRPVWPGLIGNTAFYAIFWWLAKCIFRSIRRLTRRRGGRCVLCGYSRTGLAGGAACPECGKAEES
jgi:hypothetical protein